MLLFSFVKVIPFILYNLMPWEELSRVYGEENVIENVLENGIENANKLNVVKLENVYELEMCPIYAPKNFLENLLNSIFNRFEIVPRYYREISFQISALTSKLKIPTLT